jgi:hypothetical protein
MDNPETLATLGSEDTGRKQTKQNTEIEKMSPTDPTIWEIQ